MGSLPEDLCGPDRTLIETHISWVLLGATDVWKLKKPVDFGFLDFRTLPRRRAACEAEVELNRRLAPDVYLGVVPVVRDASGRHRLGGSEPVVDYAVHMRRLPDRDRADVRLTDGRLDVAAIDAIAQRLAEFHAGARVARGDELERALASIRENVVQNFGQTRARIAEHLAPNQAQELEDWQLGFLEAHQEWFRARAEAGRIRDGHGDLRLEHVYVDDRGAITVIDCVEFNESFRVADVCCDLAFLSMDLVYAGRIDLAERLLGSYARESNDYDLYRLVNFYESYRAHVRAKVSLFLADDPGAPPEVRQRAADQARRYFVLALAEERRPVTGPVVVAVGGMIASGKSTLADALGLRLGCPVLDSDRTRKHLAGVRPEQNLAEGHFTGPYGSEMTAAVYDALVRRADAVLASGRSVVLDASFRTEAQRRAVRELAARHRVPFRFVECRAPRQTLLERLAARERASGSVSDARSDLLDAFEARWERTDGAEAPLVLDTTLPLAENLKRLGEELPFWPATA